MRRYNLVKRKDDPENFEKYLHTFKRESRKTIIAWLKLIRAIKKELLTKNGIESFSVFILVLIVIQIIYLGGK